MLLATHLQLNAKVKVTGSKVLEVDEWYHVAMNLNKQTGLSIYVDGTLDKSLESIDNIQMDFPFVASSVKILDLWELSMTFNLFGCFRSCTFLPYTNAGDAHRARSWLELLHNRDGCTASFQATTRKK